MTMLATKEIAPFLRSLRRMLDTEPAAVLCWTPDGTAFEIRDLAQLVAHVLPKYFKHAKYSSFQRQLNYFHFRKWTRSKTAVCTFSNPHFQRDAPDLTWRITRKKSTPTTTNTTTKPRLTIVVPKATTPPPPPADFDGLKSPTDATAIVHHHHHHLSHSHHQQQSHEQVYHSPMPYTAASEPALLDWSYQLGPMAFPDESTGVQSLEMPLDSASSSLDWIDSLYSSL